MAGCHLGTWGARLTRVGAPGELTFEEGWKEESPGCRMFLQKWRRGALCLGGALSLGWRLLEAAGWLALTPETPA